MNLGTEYLVCMQLSAPENLGKGNSQRQTVGNGKLFYYWCCFKNLRAKDKPEKLRIRCHDLMCSVQLITRVFHLVRAICSPVVVRLLLVCIIDHLWRPRRGEAALEKGSHLFLGISSNSHWTVLTNTFAQPFSFNHLQAKSTCLKKRSKHRNSGRIPSLIGSLTPAHGRLSRNMINNFCKRIISHPVKSQYLKYVQ